MTTDASPIQPGSAEIAPKHAAEPDAAATAPIRRQYLQIKRRFPDTILLFRLGDFYETFEEDAETAARVLDIVLTGRDMGKGVRVPMAGIPHHAAEGYIAKLVNAGHKVAICEQIGGQERGRGLIDRDVTKVITPGTVTDPALLDSHRNTYIAALWPAGSTCGLAYADLSTGEFAATHLRGVSAEGAREAAARELLRLGAAEILLPAATRQAAAAEGDEWLPRGATVSTSDDWQWTFDRAAAALQRHFQVQALDGLGLAEQPAAVQAAGALLTYLADTQRSSLGQIATLRAYTTDGFMVLDAQARRNLELLESARGERKHGLVAVLDETCTPMGARLLRRWLGQPLLDVAAIRMRQGAVEHFVTSSAARQRMRQRLTRVGDLERLANRAVTGVVNPRELGQLRQSLHVLAEIVEMVGDLPGCPPLAPLAASVTELGLLLDRALPDELPASLGAGNAIRPGFAPELDAHEATVREARSWIAGLERQERDRTGIRTLKVGYNRVFGYYLEISNAALVANGQRSNGGAEPSLPADYLPRQTLANCTRYVTTQLKEYEARVLGAQETLAHLEADVYRRIVAEVANQVRALCELAAALAYVDVVAALAEVAIIRHYVRPVVDDSLTIEITSGRHPTLETLLPAGAFVPNDARLDAASHQITILTGPNMAGKSSWLRQVALVVLLAQIGSFVPATTARVGLVDRIFTRIGAQDDISSGQSTFMVEMLETAVILNQATARSLVLLDEIGRGTSTWDGLAIARGVVEYLHNASRLGCRTLFATHFHELTELADLLPGVCCARMDVLEEGDRVVFLHHVVPGAADRSYGIHVAELAGVPRALTRRAREILTDLERGPDAAAGKSRRRVMATPAPEPVAMQLTLFSPPHPVVTAIEALEVEAMSPLEALTKLYELKRMTANDE
ncbi:MAG: DNA mismatch repair protein MutS [Thermomicrobiales bacterium]